MKKERKGKFSYVEISVILGVLLIVVFILVVAFSSFFEDAKKDRFLEMMNQYIATARKMAINKEIEFPSDPSTVAIVSLRALKINNETDPAKTKSSYGSTWVTSENSTSSYVIIHNSQTPENPKYVYYFTATDEDGNCIQEKQEGKQRRNNIYKNCAITEINEETESLFFNGQIFATPNNLKKFK